MIYALQKLKLPNDRLLDRLRSGLKLNFVPSKCTFLNKITLELVKTPEIVEKAKAYIETLLNNKQEYGYLYFLAQQNLYVKLDVRFNGETLIECSRYDEVVAAIDKLAEHWFDIKTLSYEITRVELLYFFVLLINPHLSWITVDFILHNTNRKGHAHLIAAPNRIVSHV